MKTKFTTLFGKPHEGKIKFTKGSVLMILFLAISSVVFAQTVDNVTTGLFKVYQNGKYVSQHTSQSKADIKIGMLQELYPDSINEYTHPIRTRAKGQLKVIDTIEVVRVMEFNGWVDRSEISSLKNTAYLPFYKEGVIDFKADTIYNWQWKYNFKRIKTFGKVSYENLEVPFQFMPIDSIVQSYTDKVTVRTFATKFHGVKYYVDNVLEFDYSDLELASPGDAIIYNYPVFRHTHTVKGLEPKTTYLLRVEGNAIDGSINIIEFEISTL